MSAKFLAAGSKRWDLKLLIIALVILLAVLQYKLWVTDDGLPETLFLKQAITEQNLENQKLEERNQILHADVQDLKQGQEAIEERARHELGMIKEGEAFYQILPR